VRYLTVEVDGRPQVALAGDVAGVGTLTNLVREL
jgi:hypothetical protein